MSDKKEVLVKVVGIESPKGKAQHLKIGETYEVTKEVADSIIKNKQAKKA